MGKNKGFLVASILFLFLLTDKLELPAQDIPREMRGVWVATVANIDWPSRPGLDTETQKIEALAILDQQHKLGMNAVFFQVRPVADAFYASSYEPWSAFLSGQQGSPPQPFYDPLEFWIIEAHKRGLELHAWVNPFRATFGPEDQIHPMHAKYQNPEWLINYGERCYFDPGLPQVRSYILKIVADLVIRYDIDGIHFDDYFYPYPIAGIEFPDTLSFNLYGSGILKEKDDWRRKNINLVIRSLNDTIKQLKPWVKFGISPFGVWRNRENDPNGSDTRAWVQSYDDLYADVLLWEQEGWVDYVIPQIYWSTQDSPANFSKLIHWWSENLSNRHLYIGHALYKVNSGEFFWQRVSEIPDQIRMTREQQFIRGSVFFSQRHFNREDLLGVTDSLKEVLYRKPALTPGMTWIDTLPPLPVFKLQKKGRKINWLTQQEKNPMDQAYRYVIYLDPLRKKCKPIWFITGENEFILPRRSFFRRSRYKLNVIAVDRLSNTSLKSSQIHIRY